ncbi:MAG: hypothetical protein ACHQQS_07975 [Thermoanaerobaculales bacterium]
MRSRLVPVAAVTPVLAWIVGLAASAQLFGRLRAADPGSSRGARLAESLVAGWVIGGATMLVLAACGSPLGPAAAMAPLAIALAVELLRRRGRRSITAVAAPRAATLTWPSVALLCVAGLRLAAHLTRWPWDHPWSWDHYAVWGLKARFLVEPRGLWHYLSVASAYPFSHGEYPQLLPAHLASVSWPAGDGRFGAVPDAVLALAALVVLFELWRRWLGSLAASALILLLVWPAELWAGHLVGLADRPIALLAGIAASLALSGPSRSDLPLFATALAGMGLLKNEGLPFALLLATAVLVRARCQFAAAAAVACGLAPVLAWHGLVWGVGLGSDRLVGFTVPADPASAWLRFVRALAGFLAAPDLLVLALAMVIGGLAALIVRGSRIVAVAVVAQGLLVAVITVYGPYDLGWQLSTSLPRLVVGLIPAALACLAGSLANHEMGRPRFAVP